MSAHLLGPFRLSEVLSALAFVVLLTPMAVAQEVRGEAASTTAAETASKPAAEAAPVPPGQNAPVPATQVIEEKLSDAQLEQLAAPIALHPDSLLAQILTAATYPLEVEMAARWAKANPNLKGKQLEDALQRQNWDPSVKSLTAVPQVLQMMSDKLDWTKQVGDAYLAQPDHLTTAIQRLRSKAADAGHLKTTKEQKVSRVSGPPPATPGLAPERDYIAIEPVEPDVVFVPVYNPLVVYGPWPYPVYEPFFWYPPGFVTVGVFGFAPPCFVGPALWARYDWRARRIGIHMPYYNAFHRTRFAHVGPHQHWRHNPVHRGNIAYSNVALQQRFGRPGINGNPVDRSAHQAGIRGGLPQTNPVLHRQGLTGTINPRGAGAPRTGLNDGGTPRTGLNGRGHPTLPQSAVGPRSAGINPMPPVNRGPVVNRGVGGPPSPMVNRGATVRPNMVHRNPGMPRAMGMPHTMGGSAGMPRAMMGGMPTGRPMMAAPAAPRAMGAPMGRAGGGGRH